MFVGMGRKYFSLDYLFKIFKDVSENRDCFFFFFSEV